VFLFKHYLDDQVKKDKSHGHVTCMEEERNVYKALVGKYEGKRLFGIPWCR
jgi:hypothetical protein